MIQTKLFSSLYLAKFFNTLASKNCFFRVRLIRALKLLSGLVRNRNSENLLLV